MYILILIWVYDTYELNTMMDYNNYDDYTLCTKQTFFYMYFSCSCLLLLKSTYCSTNCPRDIGTHNAGEIYFQKAFITSS